MEIVEWLTSPAYVERAVNNAYFVTVTIIALVVLSYAVYTRNRPAIYLFLFSLIVWPAIEGLVWGMGIRIYDSPSPQMVFAVVAFMEDPGWVCLAYMVSEAMYKKLKVEDENESSKNNKSDEEQSQ